MITTVVTTVVEVPCPGRAGHYTCSGRLRVSLRPGWAVEQVEPSASQWDRLYGFELEAIRVPCSAACRNSPLLVVLHKPWVRPSPVTGAEPRTP